MRHWHSCKRWWINDLPCPFKGLDEDEEEDDDDDNGFPKLPIPGRRRSPLQAPGFPVSLGIPDTVPYQLGLPWPVPSPPPGTPQLPGFPPYVPFPPAATPAPGPLPGQPPLPDPAQPRLQPSLQTAQNLVGRARGYVPQLWRPNERQIEQLFGTTRLRQGPPTNQQSRMAVAEMGAAQQVMVQSAIRRRRREFQKEQAEAAEADRQRQAARRGKEKGRVSKERIAAGAAAVVAGAGIAFKASRGGGRGGFGGFNVNMAARMRNLTAPLGARSFRQADPEL